MLNHFKTASWVVLVLAGVCAVLGAIIKDELPLAVAFGIVSVCAWFGWGLFLTWFLGLRRHVRAHLGVSPLKAVFLAKVVAANRTTDIRRALETLYADKAELRPRRFGLQGTYAGASLGSLSQNELALVPLQWSSVEARADQYEIAPRNGVYSCISRGARSSHTCQAITATTSKEDPAASRRR